MLILRKISRLPKNTANLLKTSIKMGEEVYHIPALLNETIDLLDINPEGVYVDATFGGGGHSRAILAWLGDKGRLFGFDRDMDALVNVPDDPRFTFVHADFRFVTNFLDFYGVEKVDGILADLGVSFHHFDSPERGFSFRTDSPLDMRMNSSGELTAGKLINTLGEEQLKTILKSHTDLRNTGAIARAIATARTSGEIKTTGQLAEIVQPVLSPRNFKKELSQVFQALRIVVNDETGSLQKLLLSSLKVLKRKGRIAILTYHSGEDRCVKDFFKNGSFDDKPDAQSLIYGTTSSPWKLITRNPVVPSQEEIDRNPRSRSAKLRVAEFTGNRK